MAALAGAIVVSGGVSTYAEGETATTPAKKSQPAATLLTPEDARAKAEKEAADKKS